jgi:hypothetical protein
VTTRIHSQIAPNRAPADRVWAAIDADDVIIGLYVTTDPNEGVAANRANSWFTSLQTGRTVIELVILPGQSPVVGDRIHVDHDWLGHLLDGRLCTGQGVPLAAAEGTLAEQRAEAQARATALRQTVCLVATGQAFWPASERDTETEDEWSDGVDPSRVPALPLALGLLSIVGLLVLAGWML